MLQGTCTSAQIKANWYMDMWDKWCIKLHEPDTDNTMYWKICNLPEFLLNRSPNK